MPQVIQINGIYLFYSLFSILCCFIHIIVRRLNWKYLSEAGGVVLFGLITSICMGVFAPDMNWLNFNSSLFYFGLMPCIVFNSGYHFDCSVFEKNIDAILLLSIMGTFVSIVVLFWSLYWASRLNSSILQSWMSPLTSFTPMELIALAALLSSTDPIATYSSLSKLALDSNLVSILLGESSLNDAISLSVFSSAVAWINFSSDVDLSPNDYINNNQTLMTDTNWSYSSIISLAIEHADPVTTIFNATWQDTDTNVPSLTKISFSWSSFLNSAFLVEFVYCFCFSFVLGCGLSVALGWALQSKLFEHLQVPSSVVDETSMFMGSNPWWNSLFTKNCCQKMNQRDPKDSINPSISPQECQGSSKSSDHMSFDLVFSLYRLFFMMSWIYFPFLLAEYCQGSGIIASFAAGMALQRYEIGSSSFDQSAISILYHLLSFSCETISLGYFGLSLFAIWWLPETSSMGLMMVVFCLAMMSRVCNVYPILGMVSF